MKESLTQSLQQRLQQRLSPQQVRLVRLLEMSEPEIEDEVRRELDDNPALAEVEEIPIVETDVTVNDDHEIPAYRLTISNRSADDTRYEPVAIAESETLMESLMNQLRELSLTDRQLRIANYIIGNLDDNGYMTRTLTEIEDDLAFGAGIDVTRAELREIYDTIRSLDPAGVGANDLRDSLLLQLKRLSDRNPDVELATEVVRDYFDLFSLRHFDRLASLLNVDREELRRADDVIKTLDPKPGSRVGGSDADDRARHIIPDFYVEVDNDGRFTITMPSNLPDLMVERSFNLPLDNRQSPSTSPGSARQAEALEFINRKRAEAVDFIELIRMRRSTLMLVAEAIVKWQHDFFLTEDESRLRPMVLKDISTATGLDISVVSRATAGKFIATQTGVYPMKFFFNERVNADEDASSREIAAALKGLVENEDKALPLSDDALTSMLRDKGYNIARRTVAKYRERLGIPVARLRKTI